MCNKNVFPSLPQGEGGGKLTFQVFGYGVDFMQAAMAEVLTFGYLLGSN